MALSGSLLLPAGFARAGEEKYRVSKEARAATGGRLLGPDWAATGVSIDSRTIAPGDLFVALSGPNHDGHCFVGEALAKGASAAICDAISARV